MSTPGREQNGRGEDSCSTSEMRVGLASGTGGDDEGFFGLGHGGPADFFDGVTKAAFTEAPVVEFADTDTG